MTTENGENGLAQDPTKVGGLAAAPSADPKGKGKGKAVATDEDMKDASTAEDDDEDEEDEGAEVSSAGGPATAI